MKRVVAACATAIFTLATLPPVGIATNPRELSAPETATSSTDMVNRATQFRTASGFQADRAYVEASLADASAFPSMSYGVPLTTEESAEIDRRLAVQLAVDPVIEWASGLPDFGGAYMDQQDHGTPVFQIAGDSSAFKADLAKRLPAGISARVETVPNTRSSLVATKERIWKDRAILASQGIDVQSVGLDIKNNAAIVEIGNTPGISFVASPDLSAYGSVITTPNVPGEHDTCTTRSNCVPMKGGLKIVVTGHAASWCTSGFNVRLTGTSNMRVLTAGHCLSLAPGGVGAGWSVNGAQFGTGRISTWANGANADAGLISQAAIAGADNLLFGINSGDIRTVGGGSRLGPRTSATTSAGPERQATSGAVTSRSRTVPKTSTGGPLITNGS